MVDRSIKFVINHAEFRNMTAAKNIRNPPVQFVPVQGIVGVLYANLTEPGVIGPRFVPFPSNGPCCRVEVRKSMPQLSTRNNELTTVS